MLVWSLHAWLFLQKVPRFNWTKRMSDPAEDKQSKENFVTVFQTMLKVRNLIP